MLKKLKAHFEKSLAVEPDSTEQDRKRIGNLAAAALLIEAAQADCNFSSEEFALIRESLISKFDIRDQDIDDLMASARSELDAATCLYEITSAINANWDLSGKTRLMEALWRVVLADQRLDPHEHHLMRKIQGLLYIPQSEYIAAKIRAESR